MEETTGGPGTKGSPLPFSGKCLAVLTNLHSCSPWGVHTACIINININWAHEALILYNSNPRQHPQDATGWWYSPALQSHWLKNWEKLKQQVHVMRILLLANKTHWGFFGWSLSATVGFFVLTCFNYKQMKVHTYIILRFSPFIILLVKSCDHCHGDSLIQLPWHLLWCGSPRRLFKVACFRWAKHAIRTFHWPLNWARVLVVQYMFIHWIRLIQLHWNLFHF